jgi:hypothetical protein
MLGRADRGCCSSSFAESADPGYRKVARKRFGEEVVSFAAQGPKKHCPALESGDNQSGAMREEFLAAFEHTQAIVLR